MWGVYSFSTVTTIERVSADTDPPAGTPDPVDRGEDLLGSLHFFLSQVARFTMRPAHYMEYIEIVGNFDAQIIPYGEFRFQMLALLQQNSTYAHLRVYWDVFDRVIIGEEQMLQDNPLFLYPVVLYVLVNLFLYSAQIRDPLWNVEQSERILASQRELSRIRSRQYRMAAGDPNRALGPYFNPEWNTVFNLASFQKWGARIMMGYEDYCCYTGLTAKHYQGLLPHDKFMEEMEALLQNPRYQYLRLWWHIHRMDVCGMRRMVNNPLLCFPLALCVTMNIVISFALDGGFHWNRFLNTVRRRRR